MSSSTEQTKAAFITGGARRIGAAIARHLHGLGYNISLHYHHSRLDAEQLATELNIERPHSVHLVSGDLCDSTALNTLLEEAVAPWHRLDCLINNASSFYPTPIGEISEHAWDNLFGTNLKAPLFLSQAAVPHLIQSEGCIINIVDIHAEKPMRRHVVYSSAKAGLATLTKSLAKELAENNIRVNGVAPGAIMWPEDEMAEKTKASILDRIPMKRAGTPDDIARCVAFLATEAAYITGQIISVDGGRSLNM